MHVSLFTKTTVCGLIFSLSSHPSHTLQTQAHYAHPLLFILSTLVFPSVGLFLLAVILLDASCTIQPNRGLLADWVIKDASLPQRSISNICSTILYYCSPIRQRRIKLSIVRSTIALSQLSSCFKKKKCGSKDVKWKR